MSTENDYDKYIKNVKGTMSLEGFELNTEILADIKQYSLGNITYEQILKKWKSKYNKDKKQPQ